MSRRLLWNLLTLDTAKKVASSFGVVLMPGTSHFPMVDDPGTFNRHLADLVREFAELEAGGPDSSRERTVHEEIR